MNLHDPETKCLVNHWKTHPIKPYRGNDRFPLKTNPRVHLLNLLYPLKIDQALISRKMDKYKEHCILFVATFNSSQTKKTSSFQPIIPSRVEILSQSSHIWSIWKAPNRLLEVSNPPFFHPKNPPSHPVRSRGRVLSAGVGSRRPRREGSQTLGSGVQVMLVFETPMIVRDCIYIYICD